MTYNKLVAIVFYLLTLSSCGQEKAKKVDTVNRTNFPNTKILIAFPEKYEVSSSFIGLQKNKLTAIQITEINDSFESQSKNFKKTEFTNKGGEIIDFYDLSIQDYKAKYMSVKVQNNRTLQLLLFGDDSFCVMLTGIHQTSDKKEYEIIKNTITNVQYDKKIKIDYLKIAKFKFIDDNNAKFKFADSSAGIYYFTKNGIFVKGQDNSPSIIVTVGPKDKSFSLSDAFDFTIQMQDKYGLKNRKILNRKVSFINGFLSIVADFNGIIESETHKNEMYYNYLQIMQSENLIITIMGKSKDKNDLIEFKDFGLNMTFK